VAEGTGCYGPSALRVLEGCASVRPDARDESLSQRAQVLRVCPCVGCLFPQLAQSGSRLRSASLLILKPSLPCSHADGLGLRLFPYAFYQGTPPVMERIRQSRDVGSLTRTSNAFCRASNLHIAEGVFRPTASMANP
jgi:hypothetical protein